MSEFLRLIWDICRLRRGPQDLPYAPTLLVLLCGTMLVLHVALGALLGEATATLFDSVLLLAFSLGLLHVMLALRNVSNRFVQAALALFACSLLFQLMVLPLELVVGPAAAAGATPKLTSPQAVAALAIFGILWWKLIVDAHILRHTLNVRFPIGVLVAILWWFAEYALGRWLGAPGPST